jgi:TolB-like protein
MTDSIITELSRDRALFFIARNSTFAYKGQSAKIGKVAEDFGVRCALEGSVQDPANKLRVNARLVDAMSGWNTWSASLDGDPKDVLGSRTTSPEASSRRCAANCIGSPRRLISTSTPTRTCFAG